MHLLKPIPVWMRYNNKFPAKIVAWGHTNGSGIVVGSHVTAADFKDLGGKQIAVPFWYSMHNIVLQLALRESGLTPVIKAEGEAIAANEVNLQILQPPEMPPALAAKKIDGYIVAEPFNALGELKAGGRILRFTGDIWKNHPCCVITVNEQVTQQKPEWTQRSSTRSCAAPSTRRRIRKRSPSCCRRMAKATCPSRRRSSTAPSTSTTSKPTAPRRRSVIPIGAMAASDFQPWPYPSATKLIVEAMNKTIVAGDKTFLNGLDPAVVASELVDYTFVKKALEKFPEWKTDVSVAKGDPYVREEIVQV